MTRCPATTRLGETGVETSRIGFGTSRLHYLSTSRARQVLLAAAFDHGIRHFDTAPMYGHGLAERELKGFLKGCREAVVVATKYGVAPVAPIAVLPKPLVRPAIGVWALAHKPFERHGAAPPPLTSAGLRAAVEASLRRLGTDYVDVHLLHQPAVSRIADLDGIRATYEALVAEGKVRAFGLAGDYADTVAVLRQLSGPWLLQVDESAWGPEAVPHITFGAVSRQPQSRSQAAIAPDAACSRLADALARRPDGVVLVSTTKPANIGSLLSNV